VSPVVDKELYPATVVEELIWLLSADIKMSFATPARRGHLARVCKSKPQQGTQNRTQPQEQDKSKREYPLYGAVNI